MRKIRKARWINIGLAVVMALTLTACGGTDTKETAAAGTSAGNQQEETEKEQVKETKEAASQEVKETKDTASLEAKEETSAEKQVPAEELYTITRDDINHLVTDFLRMQANAVFKASDKELNELVPIDLMDKYAGVFTTDERYKVVADYDAKALTGLENTQQIFLASQRELRGDYGDRVPIYYHVGVSVTEANIKEKGGFRYYGGTDALIGAIVKFNFYFAASPFDAPYVLGADPAVFADSDGIYNSEEDVMSCPKLCVILANCGEDTWGIQNIVADIANVIEEGKAFTGVLTNEDEREAEADITENQGTEIRDWKKVYLDVIKSGQLDATEDYCLKDINGNGIPELFTTSSFNNYQGVICYIKRDGTVGYISDAYGYTPDKIAAGIGIQGVVIDHIYQYDSGTGEYKLIFDGYIDQNLPNNTANYQVNKQVRGEQEYEDQLAAVWDPDHYSGWEDCQSVSDKTLIQAIAEYDDSMGSHNDYFTLPESGQKPQDSLQPSQEPQDSVQSSQDYILPDSGSRYLTEAEIRSLTEDEMRLARNEVYARHGRKFDSEDLQAYFNSKPWYSGVIAPKDFDESILNAYEIANLDLIRAVEGD